MTIGDRIRALRTENGLTQDELRKMTGLGTKYISALERGVQTPGKAAIQKLCDAFGVDELTLRFGERKEQGGQLGNTLWDRMLLEAWQKIPEASKKKVLPIILAEVPEEEAEPRAKERPSPLPQGKHE